MKKIALGILITLSLSTLYLHIRPMYVQPGVAEVASPRIKKAMQKMGPMKNYRILTDGRLQVMVNSQWLYLRY
jgi:hypothetical protein